MSDTNQAQYKPVTANGVNFFCQVRGKGPALLLIPSICGDSGPFDVFAEKLADQFQVITYDLRGHSRTSTPEGWHQTSMTEMADDAAALLKELGIKSAAVFGTGVGALITLELMQKYPKLVRKAILQDPLIYSVLENGPSKQVAWDVGTLLRSTFFKQGHQAAINALMRWEYGFEALYAIPAQMLQRLMSNSEVFVMTDFPAYTYYKPDPAKLAEIKTPTTLLFSTGTPAWRREMATWLGERMQVTPKPFLSEHAPYFMHPIETAEALRMYLGK